MVEDIAANQKEHEKAKKEFHKAKTIKRTILDLESRDLVVFAKLIAAHAPYGDFNIKLGLSFADVELHKERTGIVDAEQANKFLLSLEDTDNIESLKELAANRQEKRGDIVKFKTAEEHIKANTPYDASKMQEKLNKMQEVALDATDFCIPPKEEDKFKEDAVKFGINFLIDKWTVERKDIVSELRRLKVPLENIKR